MKKQDGPTNEELAARAQDGDRRSLLELWERVERLLGMMSGQAFFAKRGRAAQAGVTEEDIKQESYLAFLDAVKGFKRDSGLKFSSYLQYPMKSHVNALLYLRNNKERNNPLCNCESLNKPVRGEEGGEVEPIKFILDETDMEEEALQRVFEEQLHTAIEEGLYKLPERERWILRKVYFDGWTLGQVSERDGSSKQNIGQIRNRALRDMRKGKSGALLREFYQESKREQEGDHQTSPFSGTGLFSFRHSGSSSVERYAERVKGRKFEPQGEK